MGNMTLLLASCLAILLLCEAGLRLLHPKYAYLAEAPFIRDPNLLWTRIPDSRSFSWHPAPGVQPHLFFHNNLGLRQHRDFSAEDIGNSVNIGFFGDSFTENMQMRAQFSFTEPLDYLLNIGAGDESVNVLNFGVSGYGMAQSLLRYEMLDFRESLDHVIYVRCENDSLNDLASGLFRLDDAGRLARGQAPSGRFALLSRLHLPYLVLDAGGRLSAHLEELEAKASQLRIKYEQRVAAHSADALPRDAFLLFRQMLRRWKEAVESNGASFRLAWLPMENYDAPGIAAIVEEEGVEAVSLRDCFGARDPAHLRTPWELSPYRFERDEHWNEAGNRLAAVCLHRVLENALGLPLLPEDDVELALRRYYSAFEAPAGVSKSWAASFSPASPQADAIRRKYAALEPEKDPRQLSDWSRASFDVHLRDGHLAYVKEGCSWANFQYMFFLHVYPADVRDLPAHRVQHGFDNLDFLASASETTCTIRKKLPSYAIDHVATGQYSMDGDGGFTTFWKVEMAVPAQEGLMLRGIAYLSGFFR